MPDAARPSVWPSIWAGLAAGAVLGVLEMAITVHLVTVPREAAIPAVTAPMTVVAWRGGRLARAAYGGAPAVIWEVAGVTLGTITVIGALLGFADLLQLP